jgi:tripartite-type tricarboxylate transporter receptor subunit TctC
MNRSISCVLCTLILGTFAVTAQAQGTYPNRPIKIIVNSAPGALLDVTTRTVAQKMSEHLGQAIVVEDKPGADGMLGIRAAKTAAADGYTLLATANTIAQLPAMKLDPGYELKDFTGIGMMNQAPLIMVGAASQPDKTLGELLARATANPGTVTLAHAGIGTTPHMAAALLLTQSKVNMLQVPYKGISTAYSDILSGRVNAAFDGGNSAGPHIKEGRLRAFGITSAKRSSAFPDIPTIAEQGYPNYSFSVYLGLVAPAGTPKEVIQKLHQALSVALASDLVRERFKKDGADGGVMSPEEYSEHLKRDYQRTAKVVSDLGMTKE